MLNDGINSKETNIQSFLMSGQSNMAGRGTIGDVEPIENKNCFMLRMGRWQKMAEPINPDRPISGVEFPSGVCLAASFADGLEKATGKQIGLIPCADGGTSILQWQPGEILFDHAVCMSEFAKRTSEIKAILWHQGESDCIKTDDARVDIYKEKLVNFIISLRKALGNENLPFIIGELSEELAEERWRVSDRPQRINKIFYEIEKELPFVKVVSAKGLKLKNDGLHFDAESLRIFGTRYMEKYLEFQEI